MSAYASTSRAGTVAPTFRTASVPKAVPPPVLHPDDYERWYTESIAGNRMALALQSGIDTEVNWAVGRLAQLAQQPYHLSSMPGVLDGLFIMPEWYIVEGYEKFNAERALFAMDRTLDGQRRCAIEAMHTFANTANTDEDCQVLVVHPHTVPLIINAMRYLDPKRDEHTEFLLHVMEFLHGLAPHFHAHVLTSIAHNAMHSLQDIAANSSNRPSIITALKVIALLLGNPLNAHMFTPESPALTASLRYMPLFKDTSLVEACLNYLYVHLSQHAMAKLFLLHPDMPSILRVMINLVAHEQVEETVKIDITGDVRSVEPIGLVAIQPHGLSEDELTRLLPLPEPQRCFEWMKTMFVAKATGELTQVDFWTLYKDAFGAQDDRYPPPLGASDVIKNVNHVFSDAQAMVLMDPVQRFIIRGVDRRTDTLLAEPLKCRWDRGLCPAPPCQNLTELYEHMLLHVHSIEAPESPCLWSTCPKTNLSQAVLRSHVLTHLARLPAPKRDASQSDKITMSAGSAHDYPSENPITRPPPLPRSTVISYKTPMVDPPTTSLTALLCIRILFRIAFTSTEEAPRVDEDHFGFPGIVEDEQRNEEHPAQTGESRNKDKEGQRRGRKAFMSAYSLFDKIRIRDETLMIWVTEMYEAGLTGSMLD